MVYDDRQGFFFFKVIGVLYRLLEFVKPLEIEIAQFYKPKTFDQDKNQYAEGDSWNEKF